MNRLGDAQKKCTFCGETIHEDAAKCRYCGSWLDNRRFMEGWTRSKTYGRIAGVCAGLARQLAIPVTVIRVAFIVLTFIGGWGILLYLALWLLMSPESPTDLVVRHEDHLQR